MNTHEKAPPSAEAQGSKGGEKPQHIGVAVVTTSGAFPSDGFDSTPIHQPIKIQLAKAVEKLGIKDTSNWVARQGARELDPSKSYLDEGLSGEVEIDYGPREGGGGRE